MESVRVDKWLWAARMFKHRGTASTACVAGHVKINGNTAKASKLLRIGDRVEVLTPGGRRVLEVVALGDRRGPASEAQKLFHDHTPPEVPEPGPRRERGAGRPSKRDRRQLLRAKQGEA